MLDFLNWMDKITSFIVQKNLNPQSLNSKVLDTRASDLEASDSKVLEGLDTWVSEASDSSVSEVLNRVLSLGSGTRSRRLGA